MNIREGRIITENPLRILGVFSDSPKKTIEANLSMLRAHARTGKILKYESDLASLIGPVNRTLETIEKAKKDISLPKDRLKVGLFWFMQNTDKDKLALEYLKAGDIDATIKTLQNNNYSSVVNMAVLALIQKKWDVALYSYAYLLESPSKRNALIKAFTDTEDSSLEDELIDFITKRLINDFPSVNWIEQIQHENVELGEKTYTFKSKFENSKLLKKLLLDCTEAIKKTIDEILDKANSVSRVDANANMSMVVYVEEECKPLLKELRLALGKEHHTYIEYSDNVANQVIDSCIAYYNHVSQNSNRDSDVIKYIRFAYRIAVSKRTKDRAKENLDILTENIEENSKKSLENEYYAIEKLMSNYDYRRTLNLESVINEAYEKLNKLKSKVGKDDEKYISLSSRFVHFAFNRLRRTLNVAYNDKSIYGSIKEIQLLTWAQSIYEKINKFDKTNTCQSEIDSFFSNMNERLNGIGYLYQKKKERYIDVEDSKKSKKFTSKVYLVLAGVVAFSIVVLLVLTSVQDNKTPYNKEKSYNLSDNSSEIVKDSEPSYEEYNIANQYTNKEEEYETVQYKTGDRPYEITYGKGKYDRKTENCLMIRNGSSTDALVFLEMTNGKKIRHVFIAKGQLFTMTNIPGGEYIVKVMQGTDWNPEKDNGDGNPKGGFMNSCSLSKTKDYDAFDFPYPSSGKYGEYEITLYKVENGNMQTEMINENELF